MAIEKCQLCKSRDLHLERVSKKHAVQRHRIRCAKCGWILKLPHQTYDQ